jgi:hypothetical protein
MKPEGSLTHSQEPADVPYPEPDELDPRSYDQICYLKRCSFYDLFNTVVGY